MNPNNYRNIDEEAFLRPQPTLRDGSILGPFGFCVDCLLWKKLYLWTCIFGIIVCCWALSLRPSSSSVIFTMETDSVYRRTSQDFLSVALDTSMIQKRWVHLNISSTKFLQMSKYLSPGYLRVGGTAADRLIFKANSQLEQNTESTSLSDQVLDSSDGFMDGGEWAYEAKSDERKNISNFTMTGEDLLMIYSFCRSAGFKLLFDLNVLLRNGENWDSSNAIDLIKFADDHKLNINWQLGNEPNSFPHVFNVNITGEQLGRDFDNLKNILGQFPRYKNSLLVGPDVTRPKFLGDPAVAYLSEFLASANNAISAVTWHQYYLNGRTATAQDFLSPRTLNVLYQQAYIVTKAVILANLTVNLPIWLSETGSAYGGGASGLSNRFIAGFLWLDKLGVAARMGIQVVIRQSLYQGYYSLLEEKSLNPLPDWWLSVIYKMLVGPKVLKSTLLLGRVRMYSHCTTDDVAPAKGVVTVFGMNLLPRYITINLKGFPEPTKEEPALVSAYILTGDGGLGSKYVKMNQKRLMLNKDGTLPPFKPHFVNVKSVSMPPMSMGFFVLHGIQVPACQ